MNCLTLLGCLAIGVQAGSYGGPQTSLDDIERDYNTNDKISTSYSPPSQAANGALPSPTKFGFVPHRTASSYAATRPKFQYSQTNYQVKKGGSKLPKYQRPYYHQSPPRSFQQQYEAPAEQQQQQYLTQQQAPQYTYEQPDPQQYEQAPPQQYDTVQYVADNGLAQPIEAKQSLAQPQYYYVQQYQSPSTAVESVVDPKDIQYVSFVPNSIPIDQKYLQQYSEEPQQPDGPTRLTKYTSVVPGKTGKSQYSLKQTDFRVPARGAQQEGLFKREPKSLLDSYVPSVVQLRYLKQQGKRYSKYY